MEDGFVYIRRRSYVGIAGKDFNYRHALLENNKYPEDLFALDHKEDFDLVTATVSKLFPLSFEPKKLITAINFSCNFVGRYNLPGMEGMSEEFINKLWGQYGFGLLDYTIKTASK